MTIETVHEELIRSNLDAPMTADDALLWMTLLHTHEIHFRRPLLSDRPSVTSLAAITERHAADVMAALWHGRKRLERASSTFWWYEYREKAGYQTVEDVPLDSLHRLRQLRDQLATDPRIEKIIPED
jgi:hypothetical protein